MMYFLWYLSKEQDYITFQIDSDPYGTYPENKDTFPRICNIIYPPACKNAKHTRKHCEWCGNAVSIAYGKTNLLASIIY